MRPGEKNIFCAPTNNINRFDVKNSAELCGKNKKRTYAIVYLFLSKTIKCILTIELRARTLQHFVGVTTRDLEAAAAGSHRKFGTPALHAVIFYSLKGN